jgi:uncharacterized protein YcbX
MPIRISELVVYPVKSLRGVNVDRWPVEKRGLRHDRRWMLVDGDGTFLTQRKVHRMALFDVAFTPTGLEISLDGHGSVEVPFEPQGANRGVNVWNDACEAAEVTEEANKWFSDALSLECALVYCPESTRRAVGAAEARDDDQIGFADSNPILVAGRASIEDLNARLPSPIPIRRFRPNIVVEGSTPFEEDGWPGVGIGEVQLRPTKRCARCAVPTIDIETAKPSDEPLRTLNTYRNFDGKVCFGMFYAPDSQGEIGVGDEVTRP